jgi:hypothetical protein
VINPMIVEGQVHGGIAQGVGQALLRRRGLRQGRPARHRLVHGLHHAARRHLPSFKVGTTVTKCPSNPLGIKGCGEAGAIAAPAAVINAITDAIGTEAIAMPATPAAVWAALQKSAARCRTRHEDAAGEINGDCDVRLHLPSSGDGAAGGQSAQQERGRQACWPAAIRCCRP